MRTPALLAALALAACNPSVPHGGDFDAAPAVTIDAAPDANVDAAPIAPPSTAMETVSAAGHLTAGAYAFDVQLGGATRAAATRGTTALDTAPVLH
ncbi:MAG: hypothetical protein K8W52_21415 [Deltaproteobacteria bacterium]|nr:hypothetical protein [Deltaproteobacteria bacterium]